MPALPPGWLAQWDQGSQRWYYLEQATGRTQWELPAFAGGPPGGPPPGGDHRAVPYGTPDAKHGHGSSGYDGAKKGDDHKAKDGKGGKGGMMAGAAGGLAVGAIGGGLVGHAMGKS